MSRKSKNWLKTSISTENTEFNGKFTLKTPLFTKFQLFRTNLPKNATLSQVLFNFLQIGLLFKRNLIHFHNKTKRKLRRVHWPTFIFEKLGL